jgi:hypothetical protein
MISDVFQPMSPSFTTPVRQVGKYYKSVQNYTLFATIKLNVCKCSLSLSLTMTHTHKCVKQIITNLAHRQNTEQKLGYARLRGLIGLLNPDCNPI